MLFRSCCTDRKRCPMGSRATSGMSLSAYYITGDCDRPSTWHGARCVASALDANFQLVGPDVLEVR